VYVKCVPAERMHNLFTYSLYTFTSTCITTTIRAKTPWQGTETQAGCGWMAASKHRDISGWTAPDTAHARPISGHMASGSPTHSGGGGETPIFVTMKAALFPRQALQVHAQKDHTPSDSLHLVFISRAARAQPRHAGIGDLASKHRTSAWINFIVLPAYTLTHAG